MIDNDVYEKLFYKTLRIRLIEEAIADIYPTDKIQSPVHLSIGQEHISVGICEHLNKDDVVYGTYRGHALYLAKGGSLPKMMAELYGKVDGCGGGKAGSMHLSDHTVGMMGSSAIVASTIPHAVGSALAAKIRKTNQIVVCFFGEGATGEGVYHESLNFASKHKLPVLFVCENNDFSIYTRVHEVHSFKINEHSKAYGIESVFLDNGYDIVHIYQEAEKLVEQIRNGEGPKLMEIITYRYRQHVGPNEDYNIGYRDKSELDVWIKKDPLYQNDTLVERYKNQIQKEINEAFEFAENSNFPQEKDLFKDVV